MKLSELQTIIERYLPLESWRDPDAVIEIRLPYSTVGASPSVAVKTVQMGFDWDHGKFFIVPEQKLTLHDQDFAQQMRRLQEQIGLLQMENRNLRKQLKNRE